MTEPDWASLAEVHLDGGDPTPDVVLRLAAGEAVEHVWRNELGGVTYRIGGDRYVKWNPRASSIDLDLERRLQHPPRPLPCQLVQAERGGCCGPRRHRVLGYPVHG